MGVLVLGLDLGLGLGFQHLDLCRIFNMTIYTSNIQKSTKHILVYDKTTPICVVRLPEQFIYYITLEYWIDAVKYKLEKLSETKSIDVKDLSAKPIMIYD